MYSFCKNSVTIVSGVITKLTSSLPGKVSTEVRGHTLGVEQTQMAVLLSGYSSSSWQCASRWNHFLGKV
jgi:hypothetical protein